MELDTRQANDVAVFYHATGQLPPGISLSDPSVMEAMNRVRGPKGSGVNLNPAGGLDPWIRNDVLTGFGQSTNRIDPVSDIIIPAATAVIGVATGGNSLFGEAGLAAGTAAGHDLGGAQGAQIGGITGGLVGGAAGGSLSGVGAGATTSDTFATEAGNASVGGASGLEAGGTIGLTGPVEGGAAGAASGTSTGFNPTTGISGTGAAPATSGGSGPGASLGTDPSTSQTIGGGATGTATTPGAPALGTGAQAPIGGAPPLSQIAQGAQDLSSAAHLAASVDSLVNPAQPRSMAGTGPSLTAGTTPSVEPPIGGAQPASQIAASQPATTPAAVPTGAFQSASDDFQRSQDNAIRAQFANSGISGSPMEQRAIQQADQQAAQRSTAVQEAMASAGISDQGVFSALMSSGLPPEQFQNVIRQLKARGIV